MKGLARERCHAQRPFCFRGPLGGGLFGSGKSAPPPLVPISDAFWASGGWWDLSTIAGVNGAPYTTVTPPTSATGLGSFTPTFFTGPNAPSIYDQAIGGKRGLVTSQVQDNGLENDALASIINGTNKQWSVFFDYQQNNVGVPLLPANTLVSWGSAGGIGAQDQLRVIYGTTAVAGSTPEGIYIAQATGVGFVATQNNVATHLGYDYFRFAASYDGTALSTYVNGVLVTVTPSTWQTAIMAITKMMWGAWAVNNVSYEASNGYIRRLGVRAVPTTAPDVATVDANMVANDFILPQSNIHVPQAIFAGASIANGSSDAITNMGWRYEFATYVQTNMRSWTTLGTAQGWYALRNTVATGGTDAPTIAASIAAVVTSRTRLVVVDLGDEEIDLGQTALQVETAITSALTTIRNAVYAVAPTCRIAVNTICPLSETPNNAVCIAVNAALPGIWNASDANYPSAVPLLSWDANTAIGGPGYVQANYNSGGNDHPNSTGYRLLGAAMMAVLAPTVNSLSPT